MNGKLQSFKFCMLHVYKKRKKTTTMYTWNKNRPLYPPNP